METSSIRVAKWQNQSRKSIFEAIKNPELTVFLKTVIFSKNKKD